MFTVIEPALGNLLWCVIFWQGGGDGRKVLPYGFSTGEFTVLEGVDDGRIRLDAVDVVCKTGQDRVTLEDCKREIEVYRNRLTLIGNLQRSARMHNFGLSLGFPGYSGVDRTGRPGGAVDL